LVQRKLIFIIILVVGGGIVAGLSFGMYQVGQVSPYPFIEKEPNQFKLTNIPCSEDGSGFRVSGTDQYGFGWAGCFYDNCEYDESIERDYMKCVVVTLIE